MDQGRGGPGAEAVGVSMTTGDRNPKDRFGDGFAAGAALMLACAGIWFVLVITYHNLTTGCVAEQKALCARKMANCQERLDFCEASQMRLDPPIQHGYKDEPL